MLFASSCASLAFVQNSVEIDEQSVNSRPGPTPKRYTPEYLVDPAVMSNILYRTQDLTDEAYEELVNDIGSRAAILILRAKALGGDVRALDLYLRRCDEWRARKAGSKRPAQATNTAFVPGRPTTTPSDPLPADKPAKAK